MAKNPKLCRCGGRLYTRGGHYSLATGYRRYKVCSKCGQTYTTREIFSKYLEKPTPTPS